MRPSISLDQLVCLGLTSLVRFQSNMSNHANHAFKAKNTFQKGNHFGFQAYL